MSSSRKKIALCGVAVSAAVSAMGVSTAKATVLTTEAFYLPSAPGNAAAAPYIDMVLDTSPALTTWGEKGAVGLQGSQAVFNNGSTQVNVPASTVAFKFNMASTIDTLNSTYGAGNWTISQPELTFQYTYYANNSIFGGGAGNFETYWVANDTWAFGNGGSAGNSYSDSIYVSGTDPVYATTQSGLAGWTTSSADLGSTTYNWLSPANNPNFTSWSTAKSGSNQGMLTDNLTTDPLLVSDITSATAASGDPNVSFYLVPTSNTLGLTLFTGGGNVNPEFTFNVVSVPEPTTLMAGGLFLIPTLLRRKNRR